MYIYDLPIIYNIYISRPLTMRVSVFNGSTLNTSINGKLGPTYYLQKKIIVFNLGDNFFVFIYL